MTIILFALNINATGQAVVTVIQPSVAGIQWVVGTTHLISWTDNFTFPVRIDLVDYTIPGSPVTTNITPSAEGSTYGWAIPLATPTGSHYKIKVSSAICGDCYMDESNTEFSLVASMSGTYVHVEQPNITNITWIKGSTYLISWIDDIPGNVNIKLFKGGSPNMDIALNVVGSTYLWTIPSDGSILPGIDYRIKVFSVDDVSVLDFSDNDFTIAAPGSGTITVIQPSLSGIIWVKGNSYLISWNDDITGTVDIDLYKGGSFDSNIATDISGSTFVWLIPSGTAVANNYTVRIYSHTDITTYDESNFNFSIHANPTGTTISVVQPNVPGISWLKGYSYLISWIDNVPGTVKISLYKNGSLHSVIAENVPGSTYIWTIPNDGSIVSASDYRIRVSCMGDGTIEDYGDNDFSIGSTGSGTITVLQPNVPGITWVRGNSYLISWIDNITGTMDIELYKSGIPVLSIATNVAGSTYVWPIPIGMTIGLDYRIKIFSHTDAGSFDFGDNDFAIQATPDGGTITVVQPNGGETWYIGNSYLISWNDNFPETVDIDLYTDADVFKQIISHNVAGSTYTWNTTGFPLVDAGDYKVKISSSVTATVTDMSDNPFHLLCLPLVANIYPNPVNNTLTVKFDEASTNNFTLTFIDRFNTQVLTKTVTTDGMNELQISTADLSNGVYFLKIESEKSIITKKVIVQH
jgi:hypothetical protein